MSIYEDMLMNEHNCAAGALGSLISSSIKDLKGIQIDGLVVSDCSRQPCYVNDVMHFLEITIVPVLDSKVQVSVSCETINELINDVTLYHCYDIDVTYEIMMQGIYLVHAGKQWRNNPVPSLLPSNINL